MMSMGPGSRTPVTGAPYSAIQTTESQQALADGNQIARQEQTKVYRDSQGRVRIEHAAKGGEASPVIAGGILALMDCQETPLVVRRSGNTPFTESLCAMARSGVQNAKQS